VISKNTLWECEHSALTSRALPDDCYSERNAAQVLPQRKTRTAQPVAYYTVNAFAIWIYVAVQFINNWAYMSTILINMEAETTLFFSHRHQHVVCRKTILQPLPQWVLQAVRSSASSFYFQYLFVFLSFSSSRLCLLPSLLAPLYLSFCHVFWKAVTTQDVTNQGGLPSFYCHVPCFLAFV
jgi:hypothetical protein